MGRAIVKCARNRELYLIWDSSVDNAAWVFENREELLDHLNEEYDQAAMNGKVGDRANNPYVRVARADSTGTSMIDPIEYDWDDEKLRVMEGAPPSLDGPDGDWWIRRDRLVAYAEAILAADTDEEMAVAGHDLMHWEVWE